jgi:hypothetical protein
MGFQKSSWQQFARISLLKSKRRKSKKALDKILRRIGTLADLTLTALMKCRDIAGHRTLWAESWE